MPDPPPTLGTIDDALYALTILAGALGSVVEKVLATAGVGSDEDALAHDALNVLTRRLRDGRRRYGLAAMP